MCGATIIAITDNNRSPIVTIMAPICQLMVSRRGYASRQGESHADYARLAHVGKTPHVGNKPPHDGFPAAACHIKVLGQQAAKVFASLLRFSAKCEATHVLSAGIDSC